jgi:hypothetical protein
MSRLPDHLQPPTIEERVVRYECPKCGNNCQCGVPYVPKTVRAAEAIAAHLEKSDRAIAGEIGVDHKTVAKVRAELEDVGNTSKPESIPRAGGNRRPRPNGRPFPETPGSTRRLG